MHNKNWIITNAEIVAPNKIYPQASLVVEKGIIKRIIPQASRPLYNSTSNYTIVDARGQKLIPGLIDVHIQGAGGADIIQAKPETLPTISRTLASFGTTSFLATTVFLVHRKNQVHIENVKKCLAGESPGAKILGIHLEGPYLNPEKRGMIQMDSICLLDKIRLDDVLEACGGTLKMMTCAPELPGVLGIMKKLLKKDVVPAIGHTNATYAETIKALNSGVTHVTHLFNAMRGFNHREPGALGALLMDNRPISQIITDGVHIHPDIIRWVFQMKGLGKLCLITDGTTGIGLPEGEYTYRKMRYVIKNGTAFYVKKGTLIGTALPQLKLLERLARFTGLPTVDLLVSASLVPAKVLGIADKKGSIETGKDADLVLINKNWDVEKTWVEGRLVWT